MGKLLLIVYYYSFIFIRFMISKSEKKNDIYNDHIEWFRFFIRSKKLQKLFLVFYKIIIYNYNQVLEKEFLYLLTKYNYLERKKYNLKLLPIKTRKKLLSICIPSYVNTPSKVDFYKYLISTLKSSLEICDNNLIEINIFDNNSITNLEELINKNEFNCIVNIKRSNQYTEPEDSLFEVTDMSSGEYIYYLFSDDFIEKNFFKILLEHIKKKEYNFYFTKTFKIINNLNDKPIDEFILNRPFDYSGEFNTDHWVSVPMPASSFVISRDFHEKCGVWAPPSEGADLLIHMLMVKFSKKSYFINECISYFRGHKEQGGGENSQDLPSGKDRILWVFQNSFLAKNVLNKKKQIQYLKDYFFYDYLKRKIDDDLNKGIKPEKSIYFNFIFEKNSFLGRFYLIFLYRVRISNYINQKNFKKRFGYKKLMEIFNKYLND